MTEQKNFLVGHKLYQEWSNVPGSGPKAEIASFNYEQLCEVAPQFMERVLAAGHREGIQALTKTIWDMIDTGISDTEVIRLKHLMQDIKTPDAYQKPPLVCDSLDHVAWLRHHFLSTTPYYIAGQAAIANAAEIAAPARRQKPLSKKEQIIAKNKERILRGERAKKTKSTENDIPREPKGIEAEVLKIVHELLTTRNTDVKFCHELVYGAHTLVSEINTVPGFSAQIRTDLINARDAAMTRWNISILDVLCKYPEISQMNQYQGIIQVAQNPKLRNHQREFIREMMTDESTPIAYKVFMGQGKTVGIAFLASHIYNIGADKVVIAVTSLPQVRLQILRTAYLIGVPVAVAAFNNVYGVKISAQRDCGLQMPRLIVCGPAEAAMLAMMPNFAWEVVTVEKRRKTLKVLKTGVNVPTPDMVFCYDEPTMSADEDTSVELAGLSVFMHAFKTYRAGSKLALVSSTLPDSHFFGFDSIIEINTTSVQLGVSYVDKDRYYALPHDGCTNADQIRELLTNLTSPFLLKSYPPSIVGKMAERFRDCGVEIPLEQTLRDLIEEKGSLIQSDMHQIVVNDMLTRLLTCNSETITTICQKIPSESTVHSSLKDILAHPRSYHGNCLLPTSSVSRVWNESLRLIFNLVYQEPPSTATRRTKAKEEFTDHEIKEFLLRKTKEWDRMYESSKQQEIRDRGNAQRTAVQANLGVKNKKMTTVKSDIIPDVEGQINHASYPLPLELKSSQNSMEFLMELEPLERLVVSSFNLVIFDPTNTMFSRAYHDYVIASMQTGHIKFTITTKYGAFGTDSPFCNLVYLDEELPRMLSSPTLRQLEARVARGKNGSDRGTIWLPNSAATNSIRSFVSTGSIDSTLEGNNIRTALRFWSHPHEHIERERIAEEERIAEMARVAEEERIAEMARVAEEERIAEMARIAEEERIVLAERNAEAERIAMSLEDEDEKEEEEDNSTQTKKKRTRGKRGKRSGRGGKK